MSRSETSRSPRDALYKDSHRPSHHSSPESSLERVRQGYEITNKRSYAARWITSMYDGREITFREYAFQTREQGAWNLQIPVSLRLRSRLSEDGLYLNGLSEDLRNKQDILMFKKSTGESSSNAKTIHDRASHFFMQNWRHLAGLFYQPAMLQEGKYPSFAEVNFSDMEEHDETRKRKRRGCGFADFIGVADHFFVVDFGSKSKMLQPGQLRRQTRALQTLSSTRHDSVISDDDVIALGCIYDYSNPNSAKLTLLTPNRQDILRPTGIIFADSKQQAATRLADASE